jgi:hypothetical protein
MSARRGYSSPHLAVSPGDGLDAMPPEEKSTDD